MLCPSKEPYAVRLLPSNARADLLREAKLWKTVADSKPLGIILVTHAFSKSVISYRSIFTSERPTGCDVVSTSQQFPEVFFETSLVNIT